MTIADWLFNTMEKLGDSGVDSPRRDALVLLEDTLDKDRSWVLAHPDSEIPQDKLTDVNRLIERRIEREPLGYIRKKAWFYKRFFYVDENVLIPRPETETIIEMAKEIRPESVVDVGTGSGCIAITLALELPDSTITATDIDPKAVEICRKNAYAHEVKINILNTYLIEGLLVEEAPDLLVANLPYVPDGLITSPEIELEPKTALFGGENGMDVYENLWAQISTSSYPPKFILTESLESEHSHMNTLAAKSGYGLMRTEGLIQQFQPLET